MFAFEWECNAHFWVRNMMCTMSGSKSAWWHHCFSKQWCHHALLVGDTTYEGFVYRTQCFQVAGKLLNYTWTTNLQLNGFLCVHTWATLQSDWWRRTTRQGRTGPWPPGNALAACSSCQVRCAGLGWCNFLDASITCQKNSIRDWLLQKTVIPRRIHHPTSLVPRPLGNEATIQLNYEHNIVLIDTHLHTPETIPAWSHWFNHDTNLPV